MITENLSTLTIHKLSDEQFKREKTAGTLDATALYLTPDEPIDLTPYATIEQLNTTITSAVPDIYYNSLSAAISDINNSVDTNATTDRDSAKVKVFTAPTGVLTIMLLDNVSESQIVSVNKNLDIVLNGHVLNFTDAAAGLYLAENISCAIWGETPGSSIVKENITSSDKPYLIQVYASEFKLSGGLYKITGSVADAEYGIYIMETCSNAEITNCTIIAENTDSTSTPNVIAVANKGLNAVVKNSDITATCTGTHMVIGLYNTAVMEAVDTIVTANSTAGTCYGSYSTGQLTVKTSELHATTHTDGSNKKSYGIRVQSGSLYADRCTLFADAPGDSSTEDCAIGVIADTDTKAVLSECAVTGTHSGVQTGPNVQLYVSGGLYTGYSHGGFYFTHGSAGKAYINNAHIRDGNYQGIFTDLFSSDVVVAGGGFYVGGDTADYSCNMNVYLDSCTIEGVVYSFKLRDSGGETNNTVNLSNCTLVNGNPINITNNTHTVNVGVGGNITSEMSTYPERMNFTGKLYRKVFEETELTGQDYKVLTSEIYDRVKISSTASVGQTIVVQAVDETGKPTDFVTVDVSTPTFDSTTGTLKI